MNLILELVRNPAASLLGEVLLLDVPMCNTVFMGLLSSTRAARLSLRPYRSMMGGVWPAMRKGFTSASVESSVFNGRLKARVTCPPAETVQPMLSR